MHITAAGDRALMATLKGASAARLRSIAERARSIRGVLAAIIGHESVYVIGTRDRQALRHAAESATDGTNVAATLHRIEVSFARHHALDLDDLTARIGLGREAIVDRVAGIPFTVRYLGFRAGFAYLEGWPEEWSLPRRSTSRNLVPGGSFAVAGMMAGFYPVDSPGGWNILGRTDEVPRLLPGDDIRIVPVERQLAFAKPPAPEPEGEAIADVLAPGQLTTLVTARDWRRLEIGESAGGPFDDEMAAMANRDAGNEDGAPLLECVLVGPRLRFRSARRVAWCGASGQVRRWSARAGEEIDIGRIRDGLRGYLAIEGGVGAMGKTLCVATGFSRSDPLKPVLTPRTERLTIHAMRGPHDAPPLPALWEVTPNLDRVGVRLRACDPIDVRPPADLPSCGMQFGTLQWHPDGSVVAMGPEHPVTGGYLQPATVISSDLWKLGQLAPGEQVTLLVE